MQCTSRKRNKVHQLIWKWSSQANSKHCKNDPVGTAGRSTNVMQYDRNELPNHREVCIHLAMMSSRRLTALSVVTDVCLRITEWKNIFLQLEAASHNRCNAETQRPTSLWRAHYYFCINVSVLLNGFMLPNIKSAVVSDAGCFCSAVTICSHTPVSSNHFTQNLNVWAVFSVFFYNPLSSLARRYTFSAIE